jgi:tetratricopeptide (TPR) repeat protein
MLREYRAPELEAAGSRLAIAPNYAEVVGELEARASDPYAAVGLAESARRTGRLQLARESAVRSATEFAELGDSTGSTWSLWVLGSFLRQTGRLDEAVRVLKVAVARGKYAEDEIGRMYAFAGIAETWRAQGDFENAWPAHARAYRLFAGLGDGRGVVWALEGMGQMARLGNDHIASARFFVRARQIAEAVGDARGLAYAVKGLAEAASTTGHHAEARRLGVEAASMLDLYGGLAGSAYGHKALGDIRRRSGDYDGANATYDAAVRLFQQSGDPRGEAWIADARGDCAIALGMTDLARSCYKSAHVAFLRLGVASGARVTGASLQKLGWSPHTTSGVQRLSRSSRATGDDIAPVLTAYTTFASDQR